MFEIIGFIMIILFIIIICIPLYLLQSYSLYIMGKNVGMKDSWVAFIPLGSLYVLLKILEGRFSAFGQKIDNLLLVVPVSYLVLSILSNFRIIGDLSNLAILIIAVSLMYNTFKSYRPDSSLLFTIGSVIAFPIFLFIIKDDKIIENNEIDTSCVKIKQFNEMTTNAVKVIK